jgi:ribosomal protein S24E
MSADEIRQKVAEQLGVDQEHVIVEEDEDGR